jgi:prepilin-type N-terminal cleavage/methylation domain-containing protein
MFRKGSPKRSGFTLPEVLVTVAIVSVLAAIVVPTVTNQIGKGDDTNLQTNSASIRTGITAFVSDVRRFPGRIQHLLAAPIATDLDVAGNAYGAAAVARWRGPYMTGNLRTPVSSSPIDSVNWSLAFAIDSLSDTSFTAANGFVGVTLGGVASTGAALHIDSLIDGGTGNALGNLRWAGSPPTNERLILLLFGSR